MNRARIAALLLMATLLAVLAGCAFFPSVKPLEEKMLEGKGKSKILVVDLDGAISFKEEDCALGMRSKPSKAAFFREALLKAAKDESVAGVILRINSPGGTVAASDAIYHEVLRFREKRKVPVTAYIMELAASGGYYVASAADRIVAGPTAVTGSIGVIMVRFNVDGLMDKIGVSSETYKSGDRKDFWLPLRPTTPEEKEMLQGIVGQLYERFVDVVHKGRQGRMSREEIKALADGRVLTADDALAAGLIDGVAYLDEAIEEMKAALDMEDAKVVTYARPGDFKSNIYSGMAGAAHNAGPGGISLISINAEGLPFFQGARFMYLWSP